MSSIHPTEGHFVSADSMILQPPLQKIRRSLMISATSLKALSSKRRSSFIEDCLGLKHQFSSAISSSRRSIIRGSLITRMTPRKPPSSPSTNTTLTLPERSSANDDPDYPLSPNNVFVETCCSQQEDCIHRHAFVFNQNFLGSLPRIVDFDVNATDSFGNTCLHMAAQWGAKLVVFDSLIKAKANIHHRNNAGDTFLHVLELEILLGEGYSFITLLKKLEKLAFNFSARNNNGSSVILAFLKQMQSFENALLLLRLTNGISQIKGLWHASCIQDSSGESAETFLRRFVSDTLCSIEYRPLWRSAGEELLQNRVPKCKSHILPRELLAPDAFAECAKNPIYFAARNQQNATFLHPYSLHELAKPQPLSIFKPQIFVWRCHKINTLINAGLDPNAYDQDGFTPLMTLVAHTLPDGDEYTAELVHHLVRNGANVHMRTQAGTTALWIAMTRSLTATTKALVGHGAGTTLQPMPGANVFERSFHPGRLEQSKNRPIKLYGASTTTSAVCLAVAIDHDALSKNGIQK